MTLFCLPKLVSVTQKQEQQTSGISSKPINQGWILWDANEAVASDPIFSEMLRGVRDFSVWLVRLGRSGLAVSIKPFRSRDI